MMVTLDGGETFQDITLPEAEEITGELGFDPFDTVEKMYEEDGILYAVMGQGDDGDYIKDGKLAEGVGCGGGWGGGGVTAAVWRREGGRKRCTGQRTG